MSTEPEILFEVHDGIGHITLNRPRQINALTVAMFEELGSHLRAWRADDAVTAVELHGSGERGFCAGADIKRLREQAVSGDLAAVLYFLETEYDVNDLIATYPKPVTAHLLGISMGGGLGLGMHNTRRLGEPATRWAMPETAIGLWPDVGVCFELARTPGQVGAHLAMTGDSIDGASALWAGLLDECPGADPETSQLAAQASWIDECYAGDNPVEIVGRLAAHHDAAARAAADIIRTRCPMSVHVALQAVRRAVHLPDVAAVLDQDRALARALAADPSDFIEGVRAKMVDRDNQPRWRHARLEDVAPADVTARFAA